MNRRRIPYRRDVAVNRLGFTLLVYGVLLLWVFAVRALLG